ncbi:hypothetical protein J2Z19_002144 [Ensifer adhaerens]|uniref:Uncharacterized protein n=1 Tax=Ensifer adhaerens TaxID=106592 RepID=A0ACC5SU95_ENSAD|nr:hypothetical protein [Ensifer adhaerens]
MLARNGQYVIDAFTQPERGHAHSIEEAVGGEGTSDSVALDTFEQPMQERIEDGPMAGETRGRAQEQAIMGGWRIRVAGVNKFQGDRLREASRDIDAGDPGYRPLAPVPLAIVRQQIFKQTASDLEFVRRRGKHPLRRNGFGVEPLKRFHDRPHCCSRLGKPSPERRDFGKGGGSNGLNDRQADPVKSGQITDPGYESRTAEREYCTQALLRIVRTCGVRKGGAKAGNDGVAKGCEPAVKT